MTLSADVLNLDGSPYSYMQFSFQSGASEEAFTSFFSIEESDGGAESFEITGFNFITTNRDLDLSQWDEIIQDDDVDLHMEGGIIAKEGIKATLDTTLIEDCGEYTLCRLFKESLVYSVFKFEGFLEGDETHLVSQIDDIPIKDGVTFTNSEFVVSIYGGESGATLSTSIEGLMNAKPEEDREIILQSTWNFGQHPQNNIEIAAYSDGIYSNVFELEVLGLTNMHSTATIFNEGHLSTFSLKGLGIFGYNCFLNDDLQESLNEQESRSQEEITDLSNEEQNEDGGVEILNQSCKSSYVTLDLEEKITSMIDFDYPEDILRTFVDLKTDDNAPSIINGISIPYGLSFEYTVEDAKKENPLLFEGQMDFLSIPGEGRASVNLEEEYALVNIDIPTVKLGGGNLQLISKEELFNLYGIRENDRRDAERKLDIKMDYNDLKKSNTIKFKLEKDHLIESRLLLETNILLFEMVSREITYLNEDFIAFRIEGNPFKGQFKARTSVELITVGSIVTEDNSVMRMEIAWDNNFRKLQHMTNELLQEWVYRTIELVEEIKALKEVYNSRLTVLEEMHVPVEDCETYEQCQELPSIICEEYAQQAECVLEQEVCISMIQECTEQTEVCTRTNSEGDCLDSITKCESWENICEDDETTTICLEFETQDIPDQCLRMELSCDSTELPDNQCVSESLKTEEEMDTATESIAILDGVLDSIKQLRDSSMCLVKRSKSDTVLEDCTTNDEEITNIRDVKILDLLEITSIISNMQLSQVISSDSIIFESNILLYGDWTNKIEDSNLDLVERSDLSIEEERTNEGYNSYAKSNVKVTHTLDFKDVELSSRILYDAIRAIICSEFGVYQEESDFIQTQITMFSLIDENSRICPQMQEYDLTGLSAGLYSEAIEETEEEINSEGFEAYTYEFSQGRDEIATSEEQIAQYNTLDYQERSDEDPQDVSIADAILDSSELDIDNSEIPKENNSDSLELDRDDKHNKNYRDRNELTDAEIRAKEEEQERKERESYSLTIHREQDEIDNNRDNSDAQEVEEVTPEETQTEEATETDEDPTDIHITSE